MADNEIAALYFVIFCAGLYFGTQLKHLKPVWQFIAEKLIYKLWFFLGTDSIQCYSGEIVFVENCEIDKKDGSDNASNS